MEEPATRKDLIEFKEEVKRYMGVLAEEFKDKLNFVIDGQEDIKRDVKELKQDVGVLKQDVKEIREELIAHRDNTEIHAKQIKRKRRLK